MFSILDILYIHRVEVRDLIHRRFRDLFVATTLVAADTVVVCILIVCFQTTLPIALIVLISSSLADM